MDIATIGRALASAGTRGAAHVVSGASRARASAVTGLHAVPPRLRLPIAGALSVGGLALGASMVRGGADASSGARGAGTGTPARDAAEGVELVRDSRYEDDRLGLRKDDRLMLGYYPAWDADSFEKKIGGRNHELLQEFVHWERNPKAMGDATEKALRSVDKRGGRPVMHLGLDKAGAGTTVEAISPRALARGAGDRHLVAVSKAVNESGDWVWMRPFAEMNNAINTYCAYEADGSAKGPEHGTQAYRDAFRRTSIILHGGSRDAVDARLREAGLPELRTPGDTSDLPASGRVGVMWNPHGLSTPDIPGNQPQDYYPGDDYVDMIGGDHYDGGYWDSFEDIYERYDDKPFVVAEWGAQTDNPQFAQEMFDWARDKDRVKAMLFYDGYSDEDPFNTIDKPKLVDEYRELASGR